MSEREEGRAAKRNSNNGSGLKEKSVLLPNKSYSSKRKSVNKLENADPYKDISINEMSKTNIKTSPSVNSLKKLNKCVSSGYLSATDRNSARKVGGVAAAAAEGGLRRAPVLPDIV